MFENWCKLAYTCRCYLKTKRVLVVVDFLTAFHVDSIVLVEVPVSEFLNSILWLTVRWLYPSLSTYAFQQLERITEPGFRCSLMIGNLKKKIFRLRLNPTKYPDASYSLSSVVFSISKFAFVDFNMVSRPSKFFAAILQNVWKLSSQTSLAKVYQSTIVWSLPNLSSWMTSSWWYL